MTHLDYLNKTYPIRRTKEEKNSFQNYVLSLINAKKTEDQANAGLTAQIETTKDGKNENIVIGDPLTAKVVCTAHYDTPMHSLFPNIMIPRNKAVFWLYQFAPVAVILALSLGPVFIINAFYPLTRQQMCLIFLVLYYALYFLMFRGRKNPNNYNDNTSGVSLILTMLDNLTPEQAKNVAFILFDNEEKGKKGSKAYFNDHKDIMKDKFLLNFDCVANGDNVLFAAMEQAETTKEWTLLKEIFSAETAEKEGFCTHFYPMKGTNSNSDHKNFPTGVGCMAYKSTKGGLLYTPRIHTPRDTVAKNENIVFLAERMKQFFDGICNNR